VVLVLHLELLFQPVDLAEHARIHFEEPSLRVIEARERRRVKVLPKVRRRIVIVVAVVVLAVRSLCALCTQCALNESPVSAL
jgi:hypothetical protein